MDRHISHAHPWLLAIAVLLIVGTSFHAKGDQTLRALQVVRPSPDADRHWPRFRGPNGQGNVVGAALPATWSREENIVWRTPLPGSGNSSPVIWGSRVFLTSADTKGQNRSLHCLNRDTGAVAWTQVLPDPELEPKTHGKNGYASATPVTDGERVVAFFGNAGLVAFSFSGEQLWHLPLPGFKTTFGAASSPVLHGDTVLFVHDQDEADSFLIALDKRTGRLLWSRPRPRGLSWSTPVLLQRNDRTELVFPGGGSVRGYDANSGEELWSAGGTTGEVAPAVVIGSDLMYSSSGPRGPIFAIRLPEGDSVGKAEVVWRVQRIGAHVPTPVLFEERLYAIGDAGILTCIDGRDGEIVWQSRLGGNFSASPIESAGRLYVCSEEGKTYVVRAGPEFELLETNELAAPILASPAGLDGQLYIRTTKELFRIGRSE